jgi:hypothetical protein
MLTVAEDTLTHLAEEHGKQVATHLYGQEINAETYAICKADLLLKGEGEAADNIMGGPEYSTLSNDAFRSREFDFMLSNPPYGKSWKSDQERMGGKAGITDPRFVIEHNGDPEYSLITRSSDGQMLFLANMCSKMKHGTKLGSRIAEVHNGSSLFTGDAGQGESNSRDENAEPVVKNVHKAGKADVDPIRGFYASAAGDKELVVEYEPDAELRDTEQVPLLEDGGIEAFVCREVLPHAADAWFNEDSIKVGYEISFNRYFYKPQPLRTLGEIRGDILALEQETEGLLAEIIGGNT